MEKVSHHYVPQFYLKNFSVNKKSIGLYNLKNRLHIENASIKKQACKDHLYGKEDTLENLFMDIENHASTIIKSIIRTHKLPHPESEDYDLLLFFLLLSEARNLKNADSVDNIVDVTSKLMLSMDKSGNIPSDMIDNFKVSLDIPNLLSLGAVAKSYRIIFDLKCTLLINKSDKQFITSDNPLVRYNQMYVVRRYKLRGYGLGSVGLQLFFPISPNICICLFDSNLYDYVPDSQGNIIINKGKHVDELNKLIYLNSYQSIFFNNFLQAQYVQRIVSTKHTTNNVNDEVTILGEEGKNQLLVISSRQVNEKINLPMFRIKQTFLKMPLPAHMGGPVRPYAIPFFK